MAGSQGYKDAYSAYIEAQKEQDTARFNAYREERKAILDTFTTEGERQAALNRLEENYTRECQWAHEKSQEEIKDLRKEHDVDEKEAKTIEGEINAEFSILNSDDEIKGNDNQKTEGETGSGENPEAEKTPESYKQAYQNLLTEQEKAAAELRERYGLSEEDAKTIEEKAKEEIAEGKPSAPEKATGSYKEAYKKLLTEQEKSVAELRGKYGLGEEDAVAIEDKANQQNKEGKEPEQQADSNTVRIGDGTKTAINQEPRTTRTGGVDTAESENKRTGGVDTGEERIARTGGVDQGNNGKNDILAQARDAAAGHQFAYKNEDIGPKIAGGPNAQGERSIA